MRRILAIIATLVIVGGALTVVAAPPASASGAVITYRLYWDDFDYVNYGNKDSYVVPSTQGWCSGGPCHDNKEQLYFQSDCNLVLRNSQGVANWATNTVTSNRPCNLRFQGDANVVIYDHSGHPLWATGATYGNENITAVFVDSFGCFDQWRAATPPPDGRLISETWANHSGC